MSLGKHDAKVNVALDEARVASDNVSELVDRIVSLVLAADLMDRGKRNAEGGLRAEFEGLFNVRFGPVELFGVKIDGAEKVLGISLVGEHGEDLKEDVFGLSKLAGLVVLEGNLDGLVDGQLAHAGA
jgi:hypothetical protein